MWAPLFISLYLDIQTTNQDCLFKFYCRDGLSSLSSNVMRQVDLMWEVFVSALSGADLLMHHSLLLKRTADVRTFKNSSSVCCSNCFTSRTRTVEMLYLRQADCDFDPETAFGSCFDDLVWCRSAFARPDHVLIRFAVQGEQGFLSVRSRNHVGVMSWSVAGCKHCRLNASYIIT